MASSPQTASRNPFRGTDTQGLEPGDRALAVPRAEHVVYVVPQRVDGGWRGWRRGPPGDLEEIVVDDQELARLASSEAARDVRVLDTPGWVDAFGGQGAV